MMDVYYNNVVKWFSDNFVNIKYQKTKEMLMGAVNSNEISQLIVAGNIITRVSVFKLPGLHFESLNSNSSGVVMLITYVPRLLLECMFFDKLRKCSTSIEELLHF